MRRSIEGLSLAVDADEPLTREAVRLLLSEVMGQPDCSERHITNYITDPDTEDACLYGLVRTGDEVLAAAAVQHATIASHATELVRVTYVDLLAVDPNLRRRGYGKRLLGFIAQQALQVGDKHLALQPINTPVDRAFYESLGFKRGRLYHEISCQKLLGYA